MRAHFGGYPLTKVVHDNIPSLGDRYTITLEDSNELSIMALSTGEYDMYYNGSKVLSLTAKDSGVLVSILSGGLSSFQEGGS